jgi:prepilin-type N-terminal cleavage/methylation domain-containing protein
MPGMFSRLTVIVGIMGCFLCLVSNAPAVDDEVEMNSGSFNHSTINAPPPRGELRDALAHAVIERNVVTSQRDSLLQQRWLMVIYAAAASLLACWFMRVSLLRRAIPDEAARKLKVKQQPPVSSNGRRGHANATITIRNAETQQPELTERVATRRFFSKPRQQATTIRVRAASPPSPPASPGPPSQPSPLSPLQNLPHRVIIVGALTVKTITLPPAPAPISRLEKPDYSPSDAVSLQNSIGAYAPILLSPLLDDVIPEPSSDQEETTQVRIARRTGRELSQQGLSLLEVMLSLAILATVLTSVGGGIFSLTAAKRSASEDASVSATMQMWAERIMGADWEWLGRVRTEDTTLHGAWSWQRPQDGEPLLPGNYQALQEHAKNSDHDATVQLLSQEPSGVNNLQLYLEYYQPAALELCFTPVDSAAANITWWANRKAYRLAPPIDLRQQINAVVVCLTARWTSHDGGNRHRELLFARTK